MPQLFIIAGPNGAGKTTAAYNLLPEVFRTIEFVNADEIARGLSPFNPEGVAFEAGRIMLRRIDQLCLEEKSFALETTLSSLSYLRLIATAHEKNYEVVLFFLYLKTHQLAQERVANRVSKGGHNIPQDVIKRRYFKGLKNFPQYAVSVDQWYIYNNSDAQYNLIAKSFAGKIVIANLEIYNRLINE